LVELRQGTIPKLLNERSSLPGKLFLSQRMQKVLFDSSSKIPPASPCDRELEQDGTKTAFLIAGYARYERPFVWVYFLLLSLLSYVQITQNLLK
jgi:hypothetical protein